jgi:hypothetical protein
MQIVKRWGQGKAIPGRIDRKDTRLLISDQSSLADNGGLRLIFMERDRRHLLILITVCLSFTTRSHSPMCPCASHGSCTAKAYRIYQDLQG